MILLVGANSRLTKSLSRFLDNYDIVSSRTINLSEINSKKYKAVVITAGITNPSATIEDIYNCNISLPKKLMGHFKKNNAHIITIGTILENTNLSNEYIKSKRKCFSELNLLSNRLKVPYSHLRLHTCYGIDLPKTHMFLNDLFLSIKNNRPLEMSAGTQMRQYHHYDDVSMTIKNLINNNKITGPIDISSNQVISLKELVTSIHQKFGLQESIIFGEVIADEIDFKLTANDNIDTSFYRDPILGIYNYFIEILSKR